MLPKLPAKGQQGGDSVCALGQVPPASRLTGPAAADHPALALTL